MLFGNIYLIAKKKMKIILILRINLKQSTLKEKQVSMSQFLYRIYGHVDTLSTNGRLMELVIL